VNPPTVLPWLKELTAVESVSAMLCEPDAPVRVEPVADSYIEVAARAYRDAPPHQPNERLFAALADAGILKVPATVDPADARGICGATQDAAFIVPAEPGYPYGRRISGFLVIGRTAPGRRVAILSAKSGELSNDHYALYDVRFAQTERPRWRPAAHSLHFEDIAGIEGARWWVAAIFFFIVGMFLLMVVAAVIGLVRLGRRVVHLASR
jgi:hypothetical protein